MITDFVIPIAAARTYIKQQMALAWSISEAQALARTRYPDMAPTQPMLDNIDAASKADALTEVYMVLSHKLQRGRSIGQMGYHYTWGIDIYIFRKVDDNPHENAVSLMTRAGQLVQKLIPRNAPSTSSLQVWTGVTGMRQAKLVEMTPSFDNVQDFNKNGWAGLKISIDVALQMEGI